MGSSRLCLVSSLLLPWMLLSCGGDNLSRSQALGKLRVLVLVADKPEVQPGTAVQISPIVSFANKGNATVTHEAWGCTDPGISVGATPSCDNVADRTALLSQTSLSLSAPNYTESLSNLFSFTVSSSFLANADSVSRYNGVYYIVEYIVRSSDGQVGKAIKRISVTEKTLAEWNANPTLTNVMKTTGTALSSLPTASTGLFPNYPGAARQAYTVKSSSGSLSTSTESLTVSWFVTRGTLDFDSTDASAVNYYAPAGAGPTGSVTMVVVLRDNRGGMAATVINM